MISEALGPYQELVRTVVMAIEVVGIGVVVLGGAVVLLRAVGPVFRRSFTEPYYRALRRDLGRVVLVGLEILIVADVVETIVAPTDLDEVVVLVIVVIIRTVLSMSLDIEIDGALPWRRTEGTVRAPQL